MGVGRAAAWTAWTAPLEHNASVPSAPPSSEDGTAPHRAGRDARVVL